MTAAILIEKLSYHFDMTAVILIEKLSYHFDNCYVATTAVVQKRPIQTYQFQTLRFFSEKFWFHPQKRDLKIVSINLIVALWSSTSGS